MDSVARKLSRKLSQKIPGLRRKHIFDVELTLRELTAVPFVSGNFFCNINVNEGAKFHGKTNESQVKRHTIDWNQLYNFQCKLYSKRSDAVLDPCPCRITVIQEATGAFPQRKMGHILVDLAENAGSGDAKQALLIQQDGKRQRVGNSIFNLTTAMKIRSGDLIFRTSNVSENAAAGNEGRKSTQRDTIEADTFTGFQRVEMRPDMKPLGTVMACDLDDTRAENATNALHIRRFSATTTSGKYANDRERALRRFSHRMELLKHQQNIEEMLLHDQEAEDEQGTELPRHGSWKDIYSKRVQRQYRFSEKTKAMIGTRVSNFDTVQKVFKNVGILMDFSELNKTVTKRTSRSRTMTLKASKDDLARTSRSKTMTSKDDQSRTNTEDQLRLTIAIGENPLSRSSTTSQTRQSVDVRKTLHSDDAEKSITSIWAKESESGVTKREKQSPRKYSLRSTQSKSGSLTSAIPSEKASRKQDKEYEKLMLRRRGLEERNEQRAESFLQRVRALIHVHKGPKGRKRRTRGSDDESITSGPSLNIFEESESEFWWTKRRFPVLESRIVSVHDIVAKLERSASGLKDRSGATKDQISLHVDSKMDSEACKDFYTSLKKTENRPVEGHTPNLPISETAEQDVNKYPFKDYEFRIAEEEAIKSDEDVRIRGRRQARKNKLVLNMIKETDAYLLRETIDNNRQKAILRNRPAKIEEIRESNATNQSDSTGRPTPLQKASETME